jgi:hypothetical protein
MVWEMSGCRTHDQAGHGPPKTKGARVTNDSQLNLSCKIAMQHFSRAVVATIVGVTATEQQRRFVAARLVLIRKQESLETR